MKKVYTLTELARETDISTNGYQAFLKNGTIVGLHNDSFIVREPGKPSFRLSPSEIIPYVNSSLCEMFSISDSEFFDHCKAQFRLKDVDEEEFFEIDLDNIGLSKLNSWLKTRKIPYMITSCESTSDSNYMLVVESK